MKQIIDSIKENWAFRLIEILVLIGTILSSVKKTILFCVFLLLFVVIICIDVYITNRNKNESIPKSMRFMIEFVDGIGYSKRKTITRCTDKKSKIDVANKRYKVSGTDVTMEKEYSGCVCSETSDALKVMFSGGSSIDASRINLHVYSLNPNNRYIETRYTIEDEGANRKIVSIPFGRILSKGDHFKVKFEFLWKGSMREDYDGVVIADHLFYPAINEQIVQVSVEVNDNCEGVSFELYQYNFYTKKLERFNNRITLLGKNTASCSITNVSQKCVYFFMYKVN